MPSISPLVAVTRELLKQRPRTVTFEVIANDTNLNKRWIEAFAWGFNEEYGINRVTCLYEYLAKKPLTVA